MRPISFLTLAASLLLYLQPALGQTAEASYCWIDEVLDIRGEWTSATVCRIAGQDDPQIYPAGAANTPRLDNIQLSYDATGTECWYRTATDTQWVLLGVDGNNVAWVGYDPDGLPGGNTVLDAFIIACTSEPTPVESDAERIWDLVNEHIHEVPEPAFDPATGITGLETFVAVDPPAPLVLTDTSPITGALITAEIRVVSVTVDWGDGERATYTESSFDRLAPYPDGVARHVYETKTCDESGGARCHPTLSNYPIEVSYQWFVRWHRNAEPWNILAVPDTTAPPVPYDVDEIVTRSVAGPPQGT